VEGCKSQPEQCGLRRCGRMDVKHEEEDVLEWM
jgi:hypothetical protein